MTTPEEKDVDLVALKNAGSSSFRLIVLDVDTDPDNPILLTLFKKADKYPELQSRVRGLLNGEGEPNDRIYSDPECTEEWNPEGAIPEGNWYLAVVRKIGKGKPVGVDKVWLKTLIESTLSPEEILRKIAQHV